MSNTKSDENMTKAAEEAKAVKKEEKPAAKAPAKKEEKPAATKEKTANSAVTKEPEKKADDTADKKPAVAEKKEQPKAAVKEAEENVTAYPFTVALTHPIATYRGPSRSFVGKHFGGTVKVVGESGEFYKVSFVRSELGMTTSYMLRQEVEKCRS